MKTNVAVVIPNWNGAKFLADCLESLTQQSTKAPVIVVDNGSTDGSVKLVRDRFPDTVLVELPKNRGFAGGVNVGINEAIVRGMDYVALLNNDARADKNWLHNLLKAADKHPEAGIITGKLLKNDEKHLDSAGSSMTTRGMPFPRGRNELDEGQFDTGEHVFAGTGGASLYRTTLFQHIGLFDEDFFAYFEDDDISFRAQLAGYRVWYEPTARAYHRVSATASKLGSFTRYHSTKNFIYLYAKNMPGWLFWKYKPAMLLWLARMMFGSIVHGGFFAYWKGFFVAFLWIPFTLFKRFTVQRDKTVENQYIESILVHTKPPRGKKT